MLARTTLALLLLAPSARADDWPQWMGPNRDNVWKETGLLDAFPDAGLKVLWRTPVSGGYAGPAVAGGKVYCSDYKSATDLGEGNFERKEANGEERVFCLDEATGKQLWEHKYPVRYTISYPAGPRCTPLVHAGKVYFLGAEGDLLGCDAGTGAITWKKNLRTEYKAKAALWGYAAHPQIIDGKLITLAGLEGGHLVALDPATGAEVWKSPLASRDGQGYSPPLLIDVGGQKQLVCPSPANVRALDPATGKELWKTKYEATSGSIIMTPVKVGDYLFVGGYQAKNLMLKLSAGGPPEVLFKDKKGAGVSPVNVQPFVDDGVIYGHDESGKLFAVEVPSGKRLWESKGALSGDPKGSDTAFIVKNGERFVFFNEKGEFVFGKLAKDGYTETGRSKPVLEPTQSAFGRKVVWCMPAFANKHAYVRNDKELICVDFSK